MGQHGELSGAYTVRRAVAGDRTQLTALVRAYIDFYEEPQPVDERLDGLLTLLTERPEIGVQFVAEKAAEDDAGLCGFATVYLTYDTVAARRIAIMNDLFVAPAHRRAGLGRALILHCLEWARNNDCVLMQWVTAADNEVGQVLYDKLATRSGWVTYEMVC